jgi:hypothetical protein
MGNRVEKSVFCGTYPILWLAVFGRSPRIRILPLSGLRMPSRSFRKVVLPPPLGPIMPRNSPFLRARLTSLRTSDPS